MKLSPQFPPSALQTSHRLLRKTCLKPLKVSQIYTVLTVYSTFYQTCSEILHCTLTISCTLPDECLLNLLKGSDISPSSDRHIRNGLLCCMGSDRLQGCDKPSNMTCRFLNVYNFLYRGDIWGGFTKNLYFNVPSLQGLCKNYTKLWIMLVLLAYMYKIQYISWRLLISVLDLFMRHFDHLIEIHPKIRLGGLRRKFGSACQWRVCRVCWSRHVLPGEVGLKFAPRRI